MHHLETHSAISPERLQQVLLPIAAARGLPNAAYTSEAHFLHERAQVLGRTWSGLAFTDTLVPGPCAAPVEFMGVPLLITRDARGAVRVFHNVCSHRGMKLVTEPVAVPGLITCRYHCWSYSVSGELKATPHIGGVDAHSTPGFDRSEHGLKEVRSAVFMGILFIDLSGTAMDFALHIAPLKRRADALMGERGFAHLRPGATGAALTLTLDCNWKLAIENYCESYHLPWVHPTLNTYSRLEDHYCFLEDRDFSGQGSLAYRFSETAGTSLPRLADWPADRLGVAEYPSLYPNVLLGFHADHAFALIVTPLGAEKTREELRIFYVEDGADGARYEACRTATLAAWRTVFSEDVFAVEGMQAGRASPGYGGGVFSPVMDESTHHFHRWVAARLAESAAPSSRHSSPLADTAHPPLERRGEQQEGGGAERAPFEGL